MRQSQQLGPPLVLYSRTPSLLRSSFVSEGEGLEVESWDTDMLAGLASIGPPDFAMSHAGGHFQDLL